MKVLLPLNRIFFLLLLLAPALPAWSQNDLEMRLSSKDPAISKAAADELVKNAGRAEPLLLMSASYRLFLSGEKDQAVFWFYAGQLRARYSPKLTGENSQLLAIYLMTMGAPINAHAMLDISKMTVMINKVMSWDEQTFEPWCKEYKINPQGTDIIKRRKQSRDGFVAFADKLTANRGQYEKQAREYKSPEQLKQDEQERQTESVKKNYTTAVLERVIGGKTLRIPANYITPWGLAVPLHQATSYIGITLFLPNLEGYTRDNWRDRNNQDNKNVIQVGLRSDLDEKKEERTEAFIATGPPKTQAFGFDAYLNEYKGEYVLVGKRTNGAPFYLICDAPKISHFFRCELFFLDQRNGLRVRARFHQDHATQWLKIEARISELLTSWLSAQ